MTGIRKDASVKGQGPAQPVAQKSEQLPIEVTTDAVARAIVEAADAEEKKHGFVSGAALDAMLKRAMEAPPGQMSDAATAAIDHVVERRKLGADAQHVGDIIRRANGCRKGGRMHESHVRDMMKRAWDADKGEVRETGATALRYVGWRDADIMDKGARQLMTSFITAWYEDMVESGAAAEGRKQIAEQLAQDKRDFTEFMRRDKSEHKRQSYNEFRQDLQEKRIESSEWQTLMIWLQTGHKQKPITSKS